MTIYREGMKLRYIGNDFVYDVISVSRQDVYIIRQDEDGRVFTFQLSKDFVNSEFYIVYNMEIIGGELV